MYSEREEASVTVQASGQGPNPPSLVTTPSLSSSFCGEETGAYCLGAYVHHKGIDVVLGFGQLIEEGHDIETRVLQQPEPQGCGRGEPQVRECHTLPSPVTQPRPPPFPRCSAHITHLLGSLSFFTFLLSLKYSARLLLEEEAKRRQGSEQSAR